MPIDPAYAAKVDEGVGAFIMEDDKGKAAKAQLLAKDANRPGLCSQG